MTLEELRKNIDSIDNQLLTLLNDRMKFVHQVGELKRSTKVAIYRPEREKEIIDRLEIKSDGLLNRAAIEAIFTEIFAVARNLEMPERIAYVGPAGSFTHQAAESRFGPMSEYMALATFRSVVESVEAGRARFGVIPIENSREGTVPETVDILFDSNVKIAAELAIDVNFSFASHSEKLEKIKKIYTKEIAFRQCSKFLREYFEGFQVEMISVDSTSKAAKLASEDPSAAAICSHIAAKLFELPVLFDNIGDSINNRTRFYILAKDFVNQKSDFGDKTTIIVELPHTDKPGVLATFLQDFKERNINLTKIENRPYKNSNDFSFWFFMELEGYYTDEPIREIFEKYEGKIKVLGSYVRTC